MYAAVKCFVTIRIKQHRVYGYDCGGHLTKNNPQPVEFVTHGIH